VKESFEFEDAGRKFECSAERMRKTSPETWWWFRVSTEEQNRYAPFRTADDDTLSSVQERVVAYYNELLVRRAAPPINRWQRGGPKPAGAPGAEVPAAAAGEAVDAEAAEALEIPPPA
jgi:hypothetical protein